jgi:hypothetical protein
MIGKNSNLFCLGGCLNLNPSETYFSFICSVFIAWRVIDSQIIFIKLNWCEFNSSCKDTKTVRNNIGFWTFSCLMKTLSKITSRSGFYSSCFRNLKIFNFRLNPSENVIACSCYVVSLSNSSQPSPFKHFKSHPKFQWRTVKDDI